MGKRKSKGRVVKKKTQTVPTVFDCIFCNHAQSVECKLNASTNIGTIRCRVCAETFQMEINHLTDPIDIYSEWIDEAEKANKQLLVSDANERDIGEISEDEAEAPRASSHSNRRSNQSNGRKRARLDIPREEIEEDAEEEDYVEEEVVEEDD